MNENSDLRAQVEKFEAMQQDMMSQHQGLHEKMKNVERNAFSREVSNCFLLSLEFQTTNSASVALAF